MNSKEAFPEPRPKKAESSPARPEGLRFEIGIATLANENHLERNEDSFFSLPEIEAFAVFDGVGGHYGGDIASAFARDHIGKLLGELPAEISEIEMRTRMIDILVKTHEALCDKAEEDSKTDPRMAGLATTACVIKFFKNENGERRALVANAGDSRAYVLKKDGTLRQITIDNSAINDDFKDSGESEVRHAQTKFSNFTNKEEMNQVEKALWHTLRGIVSNAIGMGHGFTGIPDIYVVGLEEGDIILLSSDGVHDNLTDTRADGFTPSIEECLKMGEGTQAKAEILMHVAKEKSRKGDMRSKPDDMTALVIKVLPA